MNVGPIMKRELRAQARQPFTYWLRTTAVAVMLVAAVVFGLNKRFQPGAGGALLATLHACLFLGIWIFVPTMTADCLSRERREGTLSLLFLTNLRPFDIVLAKTAVHALRAFTFGLATLPVLTLPFLIGGAGWEDAVFSTLLNFTALCLALGAGLLASSQCKAWVRAMVLSACIGAFTFALFLVVHLCSVAIALRGAFAGRSSPLSAQWRVDVAVAAAFELVGAVSHLAPIKGAVQALFRVEMGLAIVAALFLLLCLWLAARNIAKHLSDEPPSAFARWLERKFCTPVVAVSFLKRSMRGALSRNPVGWLEVRSWSARLTTWSWFGVVVLFYTFALTNASPYSLRATQPEFFIGWLLAGTIAFNAAGSFRRERESGVLELLLVSPLSVAEIVIGRLLGIWGQFLPATSLFVIIYCSLQGMSPSYRQSDATWFFAITFLTLPIVGLYFSLARSQFMSALFWTLGVGLFVPFVIGPVGHWLLTPEVFNWGRSSTLTAASPLQVAIALYLWHRLHTHLAERKFNLERSGQ